MGGHIPPPSIPGQKAEGNLLHSLRTEVAQLLGRDSIKFPGAQPVSFASKHLLELQKQDYYLCEKSDGIRCLMYLTNDGANEVIYLIDRKNDYYWVETLHFPLPDDEILFHVGTLVDGELVNDIQGNGEVQLKYLVFDCMALDGTSLVHRTLDKRLAYFRAKVYEPYRALFKKYPEEIQHQTFLVDFKKMELSYGIEMMFRDILPNLPHGNDGLIFTCVNTPYKFGTDQNILKWKRETENSIDFIMTLSWPMLDPDSEDERDGVHSPYPDYMAKPQFNLGVMIDRGQYQPYGIMHVEDHEWAAMKALNEPLDDRIVECYQDQKNRWRFMRFRDDKAEPNHISTVESVIESIQDRISERDLIIVSKKIRDEWKRRQAADEARKAADRSAEVALRKNVSNGHNGANADQSAGAKRKLESADSNGHENAKRKITPQPGP